MSIGGWAAIYGSARLGSARLSLLLATLWLLLPALVSAAPAQQSPSNIDGVWSGDIVQGDSRLQMILRVADGPDGKLSISADVPKRGWWGLSATDATLNGIDFSFDIPSWVGFHYAGTLDHDGKTISGAVTWRDGVSGSLSLRYQHTLAAKVRPSRIDGDWFGLLRSRGSKSERLELHVKAISPDELDVWLDGLDRIDAMALRCEKIKFDRDTLAFEVPLLHATYEGKVSADGKSLTGVWNQATSLPLEFRRRTSNAIELSEGSPVPAIAPASLDRLKQILDREFAPITEHGLLAKSTGGGVVIGVLDHGRRRIFSYGAAHRDSIFELGSITKTFTGLALAQMVEQKKVTLDEPVRELLPVGTLEKIDGSEITLLDLATHHSGLPRLPNNLELAPGSTNPFADYDIVKLRAFFSRNGSAKPPGAKFLYSNFGFGLLGYALAQRAGTSYEQLIRTEVTGPLGLNDTVVTLSPEQKKRMIQGYDTALDPVEGGAWDYPFFVGAGGLKSTASDMLTYLNANMHPAVPGNRVPAGSPAATLAAAFTIDHQLRADAWQDAKIALAWVYNEKLRYYSHGGGTENYSSLVGFSPEHDQALVVLYNRLDDTPVQRRFVDRIAENIGALMSGMPSRPIDSYPYGDRALVEAARARQ
ncbi:MAG: serine hydrolase domain-containing protein [Candidatus Binataceae bacterium]